MAKRRKASAKARPGFCPACDARLPGDLAHKDVARCPACDEALVPVRVGRAWRRAAAGTVDALLLAATAGLLNWGLLTMLQPPALVGEAQGLDAALRLLEVPPEAILERIAPALVMSGLYFGVFWAATGRTPGQRLLRLRVVGQRGWPPSPARSAVRVLGKFLALAIGGLGWIWVAFDRNRRGWHDHLAGTYVIYEPGSPRPRPSP